MVFSLLTYKILDNILILGEVNSVKEAKKWVKDYRSELKQLPKIFGGVSLVGGEFGGPGKYRVYIVAISKECRGCPSITRCIDSVVKGHVIKSFARAREGEVKNRFGSKSIAPSDCPDEVVADNFCPDL